ncbi:MAG: DUF1304 domain-containing protein [Myxococcota bacterium]
MLIAAQALTLLVAVLHVAFFAAETLFWTRRPVRRRFGFSAEDAETTRVLASNQGVYNLGLAVGLLYSLLYGEVVLQQFLLAYIVAMGLYGGATAKATIVVIQALPAALALGLLTVQL